MVWQIKWTENAFKSLEDLSFPAQKEIRDYLVKRISPLEDPKVFGKPLTGSLSGMWRYRVGDYRIICRIIKNEITILVLDVGHRKSIYE